MPKHATNLRLLGVMMSHNRHISKLENLMVKVLKKKGSLSLIEIVDEIIKNDSSAFTGKTPLNSLYSIVYRNEKKRLEQKNQTLFLTTKERREIVYSLNPEFK